MGAVELEQARDGFERGDWIAAYQGWSVAAPDALSSKDLDDLATAAELLGRHDDAVAALQRAFVRSDEARDLAQAVRCAFRLAMTSATHGQPVAMGMCAQGRLALYSGRVPAGLRMLDEAMVRVLAGETSPIIAGHVYCTAQQRADCQGAGAEREDGRPAPLQHLRQARRRLPHRRHRLRVQARAGVRPARRPIRPRDRARGPRRR